MEETASIEDIILRVLVEVRMVIGVLSTLSNILVIIAVLRSQRLRRLRMNIILLNKYIMEILLVVISTVTIRNFLGYEFFFIKSQTWLCLSMHSQAAFIIAILLFVFQSIVDWIIQGRVENTPKKFSIVCKLFLILPYMIVGVLILITAMLCTGNEIPFSILNWIHYTYVILLICLLLLGVIANVWYYKHKKPAPGSRLVTSNVSLALFNIFLVMWIPVVILQLLPLIGLMPHSHISLRIVMVVCTSIPIASPILNFLYLMIYGNISILCSPKNNDNGVMQHQSVSYRADKRVDEVTDVNAM